MKQQKRRREKIHIQLIRFYGEFDSCQRKTDINYWVIFSPFHVQMNTREK